MGRFRPIRQFRVSEEVLSQLKESILLGKFKSGEKLPAERELTEEFQVSRSVVREAIRALEITGFVILRQVLIFFCPISFRSPSWPMSAIL